MTAALGHLTGSTMRSRANATRALGILALVLPVPVFAALGLSLPLPATVERIAARLVPFGHAGALDTGDSRARARGGRIVLAPGEQGATADPTRLAAAGESALGSSPARGEPRGGIGKNDVDSAAPARGERGDAPAREQNLASAAPSGGGSSAPSQGGSHSGAAQPGGTQSDGTQSGGTQSGGGSDPGNTTANVVDTVGSTADGAVSTATGAASSATTTVTDTSSSAADTVQGVADSAGDTATGALGGIHPP